MKYKHIFIDLDRTIYDFDKSTHDTFLELFDKFGLYDRGVPFEQFFELYKKNNVDLWDQYREGKIAKKFLNVQRFDITLKKFGINDRAFAGRFASDYLINSPLKKSLFPNVIEVLEYLKPKYTLHIITNGFEEVQVSKLEANDLNKYFTTVTTSEEAKAKKPKRRIFEYAFKKADAKVEESLMIGDDLEVDILGALAVGMDGVYCNYDNIPHNGEVTFEIKEMLELKNIL
ncbi:MAG: YjjG family noncanonical pyrimidine nucleotidase [Bacteroidales bacterium]|nr:YjjG family noncanonical pyrimidine nucleotidase [Bacteroidales bacterium]